MKSVYVGNLPFATTDTELKALFEPYGTVLGARIKTDRDTGRPLGYGFVQLEDADAAKAIEALDGKEFAGRNLRVNESREKTPSDRPPRREFNGERKEFHDRGDRPPRREFNRDRIGDRPPRREFNRDRVGDHSAHHEFNGERKEFHGRPPRHEFNNDHGNFHENHFEHHGFNNDRGNFDNGFQSHAIDDYEPDQFEDGNDYPPTNDFDNEPRRRRNFGKKNNSKHFQRDFRDSDRPRRPFVKSSPRKKGFRPNEDYDSEE